MSAKKYIICRRPNKYYYIRIQNGDSITWKSTGCKNKSDATAFLRDFKETECKAPVTTVPLLSEYIKTYAALNKSVLRTRTLVHNIRNIDILISLLGDRKLDAYVGSEFEMARTERIGKNWCVVTANSWSRSVKAVFNYAVQHDVILVHPFAKNRPLKTPQKAPLFFKPEEFKKVLDNVNNPMLRDFYTVLAYSGVRLSELVFLRTENVDLEKRVVNISNYGEFTTKSGKERSVPISDVIYDIVKRRMNGTLLFGKEGKYPYDGGYISRCFRDAVRKVPGIDRRLHLHSCRHSFASWAVSSGVSIYHVSKLLGHSNISTTEIYAHCQQSDLQDAVKKLPSL